MTLYMKCTTDKYELPIAVADSPSELAKMLGTNANVVSSSISHQRPGWFRLDESEGEESEGTLFV